MDKLTMRAIIASLSDKKTKQQVKVMITNYLLLNQNLIYSPFKESHTVLTQKIINTLTTTAPEHVAALFAATARNTPTLKGFIDVAKGKPGDVKLVFGFTDLQIMKNNKPEPLENIKFGYTMRELRQNKKFTDTLNTLLKLAKEEKGANAVKGAEALQKSALWNTLNDEIKKLLDAMDEEEFIYKTEADGDGVVHVKPNKVFGKIARAIEKTKQLKDQTNDKEVKDKLDKVINELRTVMGLLNETINSANGKKVSANKYVIDDDYVYEQKRKWENIMDHLSDYVLENANEYSKLANLLLEKEEEDD